MRIFISTGEVSGDMQGALLIDALKRQATNQGIDLEIVALGGDRMAEAGAMLLGNTTAIGSMGLIEAVPFILPTWQVQRRAKRYLKENPPDLLVLIDYEGANVPIGETLRKSFPSVPIVYYIAPQQWVWTPFPKRTQIIADITDRLLAIFPEEARFYEEKGISVAWVGHPLVDKIKTISTREEARQALGISPSTTTVALLPASRKQELTYLLPTIFEAARRIQEQLPEVHFLIPLSLEVFREVIVLAVQQYGLNATVLSGKTLDAIAASDLAITKSGTVNLEIALLNVPQVVMYKVNPMTIWIARKIFKMALSFVSPVNLLVMKKVVPELLQEEATPERIVQESLDLLLNKQKRKDTLEGYQEMRKVLGEEGVCDRAASEIIQLAQKTVNP